MSIVMVGPFPGPFNRTHYSDSTSEDEPQPPYAEAEYAVPEQCSHYMPPDDVAYRTPQPDPAVPLQLPMYQERPPALPAPLPKPRSVALAQRMWKAKLCRVGAVAAMMAVVALVALAVTAPGEEQPQVAPVKPMNASKAANITQSKGATGPRRQSSKKAPPSTIRTSPHTEEDLAGHSVDVVAGLAEQTPREDSRVADARRDLQVTSTTRESTQSATSTRTASVVPRSTALRGESESTTLAQRTTPAPSAAEARTPATTTAAMVTTMMARTAEEVAASSGLASTDVGLRHTDGIGLSLTASDTAASPLVTSSAAPPPLFWSIGSTASPPTVATSTTDVVVEVVGGAEVSTDVQEV